jgi:hypothetical protein
MCATIELLLEEQRAQLSAMIHQITERNRKMGVTVHKSVYQMTHQKSALDEDAAYIQPLDIQRREDEAMSYTISVVMRITVIAIMLLGLFFFVLLALLSIARELVASEHHQPPALPDNDSRTLDSMVHQARLQFERR